MQVPCIGGPQPVQRADLDRWQMMYPRLDVRQVVLEAIDWVTCCPERRKKNGRLFLSNWLRTESKKVAPPKPTKNVEPCKCGRRVFAKGQCGPCYYDPKIGQAPQKFRRKIGKILEDR